jgi:hypothetical protein
MNVTRAERGRDRPFGACVIAFYRVADPKRPHRDLKLVRYFVFGRSLKPTTLRALAAGTALCFAVATAQQLPVPL